MAMKAFLEQWAEDVWAMPASHKYLSGKATWSEWFNGSDGGRLIDNDRMNGMEGLADKFLDVQHELHCKVAVDKEAARQRQIEKAKEQIDAAAQFTMAVNFVAALLVTVQLSLVCSETQAHPMMAALLNKMEEYMHIAKVWYCDVAFYKDGSVALEEPVEVHVLTYLLQHLAAMWLLFSVKGNLLLVVRACKGYGHIMYWCPDLETKLWYARSMRAQWVQHRIRDMGNSFMMSLFPYLCLLQGPIVGGFCMALAWRLKKEFEDFNVDAAVDIALHVAAKVRTGFKGFESPPSLSPVSLHTGISASLHGSHGDESSDLLLTAPRV